MTGIRSFLWKLHNTVIPRTVHVYIVRTYIKITLLQSVINGWNNGNWLSLFLTFFMIFNTCIFYIPRISDVFLNSLLSYSMFIWYPWGINMKINVSKDKSEISYCVDVYQGSHQKSEKNVPWLFLWPGHKFPWQFLASCEKFYLEQKW